MASASPPQHGVVEGHVLLKVFKVVFLGVLYILTSCALIAFNKYLLHEERFPFAAPLVWLHTILCSIFSVVLYLCCPSLFPSLTDSARKVEVDRWLFLTGSTPIGAMLAIQLILSNTAFLHLSLAFVQMCKKANVILVYAFSLMLFLERFSWYHVGILGLLMVATAMTIVGELHFSWKGFAIQMAGQVLESGKLVLQSKLLSGRKLDALTYVMLVMPFCMVFTSMAIFGLYIQPMQNFRLPAWADLHTWWPYLLANAVLAFCLNVSTALFVKSVAAMGMTLSGIVKDIGIVTTSHFVLGDAVSSAQGIGFMLQLFAISLWSWMKMYPAKLEVTGRSLLTKLGYPKGCAKDEAAAPLPTTLAQSYGSGGRRHTDEDSGFPQGPGAAVTGPQAGGP